MQKKEDEERKCKHNNEKDDRVLRVVLSLNVNLVLSKIPCEDYLL